MKKNTDKVKKEPKKTTKKQPSKRKNHKLMRKLKKYEAKIKAQATHFRFKSWASLSYPYIILMIILIVLPLLIVLLYSIIQATNNAFIFRFTFDNFNDFFSESSFVLVLVNSIIYSFFATVLAALLGYPVAYIMAFKVSKLVSKNVWILVTLPIWINMLLRTIGLSIVFAIVGEDILIGTPVGIILALTYMFLPFMILPIYNSLEKTDHNLLEASQDLGASSTKTFWKVTFRFSLPGVFSGFTLMMLSAMTSLIVVKYIGGGKSVMISNIIESYFYRGANFALGAAISVILGIIVLIIIVVLKLLGRWATGKKIWD
ncbi:spermidine/putrescine ABC transporter permease [Spiroplasma platyhelix]|uniref:ABC transporter permease n=1 Tax=Spiroplasma platyhelix PALS-1 TaxID=1276218 RepID=A0A846TRS9_9MOLU|nr:spermidine/putrescine ABC transporter permease [Spiroplasma platyhelix]MBE4703832.1 hypothetical protein [Spiroplasma platyhelix PALS-1]NKE38205.1 ABC transporter permease [Spiroplasma platyhelix PALS-1]UJB29090.1 spermidine/putrescine ABC transporter permease [Spiroplasma platyhelix PALS-1]